MNLLGRRGAALQRGDEDDATHRANHHLIITDGLHAGVEGVGEDVLGPKILVELEGRKGSREGVREGEMREDGGAERRRGETTKEKR